MADKSIGCTRFTDRECREEDCCVREIKIHDAFYHKEKNLVVVNYWSISCEREEIDINDLNDSICHTKYSITC